MREENNESEIKIIRIFNAPVKTVWEAWTDENQVAQWWGPRGFTLTTHSKDLREGGHWHYTMHGSDGTDYINKTKYFEVVKESKLVYDHGGNDEQAPLFRVTVLFFQQGSKTKMDMTMTLPSPEAARDIKLHIKNANGNSTWDRFAEYLEKHETGHEKFIIARSFDAPIETMFDMWTDPVHLTKWAPPAGATMELLQADIKVGGGTFYKMVWGNSGMALYGRARYLEILPPTSIIYTQQFCDENENISRHPMVPVWPETMLTHVTFDDETPNRTRVTVTWEPYGDVQPEELEAFIKLREGMTQGWTGSFDKLESELSKIIVE